MSRGRSSNTNLKSGLRKIHTRKASSQPPANGSPSLDNDINVVIVPDAVIKSNGQVVSLVQTIKRYARSVNAYLWSWSWLPSEKQNIYHSLQDSGQEFFDVLQSFFEYKTGIQPLILVGYGFGGIIIKEALNILRRQAITKPNELLRLSQQGIIFLGVPHPTLERRTLWYKVGALLRALEAFEKKHLEDGESVAVIAKICSEFENGVHPHIFSFYEKRPTKIGLLARLGLRRKDQPLLGADIAKIHIGHDKRWPIATDYHGLRKYRTGSEVDRKISRLLQHAISISIDGSLSSAVVVTTMPKDASDRLLASITTEALTTSQSAIVTVREYVQDPFAKQRIPKMPFYERQGYERHPCFIDSSNIVGKLDRYLSPHDPKLPDLRICALSGLGGIGKTQNSLNYTLVSEDKFDAILWIPADEDIKIASAFRNIAERLGLASDTDLKNSITCRDLVLKWLSTPQKKLSTPQSSNNNTSGIASWLIVFDNMDSFDVVRPYWPYHASGSILITTRNAELAKELGGDNLPLESMTEEACTTLLNNLVHEHIAPTERTGFSETAETAAKKLVQEVGYLPLAISHCAAIIREERITIDQFLINESKEGLLSKLMAVKDLPPGEQYKQTLKTVWKLEKFSSQASDLMAVMVFMDPDSISEDMLIQTLSETRYSMPAAEYKAAQEELVRDSIITRSTEKKTISWHRVVREVAEEYLRPKRIVGFDSAVQLLRKSWPTKKDKFNTEKVRQQEYDKIIPHVRSILKHSEMEEFQTLSKQTARDLAHLLGDAAWYLTQLAEHGPVKPMLEKAMAICKSNDLKDIEAYTAFVFARYGEETNMDPQRVFIYCERFHELAKELNDQSQERMEDEATSHTSLAKGYLLLDEPKKALEHCTECITMDSKLEDVIKGEDAPQYAQIYGAWACLGLKDYTQATDWLNEVINFRRKKFGEDDKESVKLGLALQCLGNVRMEQPEFNNESSNHDTAKVYQRALSNFNDILGPNSFRAGQTCVKLAELHIRQGSCLEAELYFDQAERIFRQSEFRPELARCLYLRYSLFEKSNPNSGDSLQPEESSQLEEFPPSRKYPHYDEAIRIYRELVPADHQPDSDINFDKIVRFWSR